jgi:hypothetical protein
LQFFEVALFLAKKYQKSTKNRKTQVFASPEKTEKKIRKNLKNPNVKYPKKSKRV